MNQSPSRDDRKNTPANEKVFTTGGKIFCLKPETRNRILEVRNSPVWNLFLENWDLLEIWDLGFPARFLHHFSRPLRDFYSLVVTRFPTDESVGYFQASLSGFCQELYRANNLKQLNSKVPFTEN